MITWDKPARTIIVSEGWKSFGSSIYLVEGNRSRTVPSDRIRGFRIDKIIVQDDNIYEEFLHSELGHLILPCLDSFNGIEIIHKNYVKFKLKKLKFL